MRGPRDQLLANMKHDYLEAQINHMGMKLINAEIEIEHRKKKNKVQELEIKMLQRYSAP